VSFGVGLKGGTRNKGWAGSFGEVHRRAADTSYLLPWGTRHSTPAGGRSASGTP